MSQLGAQSSQQQHRYNLRPRSATSTGVFSATTASPPTIAASKRAIPTPTSEINHPPYHIYPSSSDYDSDNDDLSNNVYDCYFSPLNTYIQPSIPRQPQHVRTTVERRSTANFTNFPIYSTRGRVLDSYHTQNLVEDRNFPSYQDTSSSATLLPSFSPDCSSKTPSRVDSIQSISTSTNVFEAQTSTGNTSIPRNTLKTTDFPTQIPSIPTASTLISENLSNTSKITSESLSNRRRINSN